LSVWEAVSHAVSLSLTMGGMKNVILNHILFYEQLTIHERQTLNCVKDWHLVELKTDAWLYQRQTLNYVKDWHLVEWKPDILFTGWLTMMVEWQISVMTGCFPQSIV